MDDGGELVHSWEAKNRPGVPPRVKLGTTNFWKPPRRVDTTPWMAYPDLAVHPMVDGPRIGRPTRRRPRGGSSLLMRSPEAVRERRSALEERLLPLNSRRQQALFSGALLQPTLPSLAAASLAEAPTKSPLCLRTPSSPSLPLLQRSIASGTSAGSDRPPLEPPMSRCVSAPSSLHSTRSPPRSAARPPSEREAVADLFDMMSGIMGSRPRSQLRPLSPLPPPSEHPERTQRGSTPTARAPSAGPRAPAASVKTPAAPAAAEVAADEIEESLPLAPKDREMVEAYLLHCEANGPPDLFDMGDTWGEERRLAEEAAAAAKAARREAGEPSDGEEAPEAEARPLSAQTLEEARTRLLEAESADEQSSASEFELKEEEEEEEEEEEKPAAAARGFERKRTLRRKKTAELRKRVQQAFYRLMIDAEFPTDRLSLALIFLGHRVPEQDWIADYEKRNFDGRGLISKDEFFAFINEYEEMYIAKMEALFYDADRDRGGWLSAGEISSLLRDLGVTPVSNVVHELIFEVTGVRPSAAKVDIVQFVKIFKIVRERAGFTASESETLRAAFERHDRNSDGKMERVELEWCMSWLGFSTHESIVGQLMRKADVDNSGTIEMDEFFTLMRMHREQEVEKVMKAFCKQDKDFEGHIPRDCLPNVFDDLGYPAARPKVLKECSEKANISKSKEELLFEDIYNLLAEYRRREGFLDCEREEIKEMFEQFANKDGLLGGVQLPTAIRWLGYRQAEEDLNKPLKALDLDGGGDLVIEEFTKLLKGFYRENVRQVREAFKKGDLDGSGTLSSSELRQVLLRMGFPATVEEVAQLVAEDEELNVWEFVEVVEGYRRVAAAKLRANQGFTDAELRKLRYKFNRHDKDNSGNLHGTQVAALLEELFPASTRNLDEHHRAAKLLAQGDADKDGTISFEDFLAMARLLCQEEEERRAQEEAEAAKTTNFSKDEISEFRKVFKMYDDDGSGDISFDELREMFEGIVPLGHAATQSLQSALTDVDENGNRQLDFGEFLRIMSKLQEENWSGLNDAVATPE